MNDAFDPKNNRVKLASQKHLYHSPLVIISAILIFIALVAGGTALLIQKESLGWIAIGFAVYPLILIYWIKRGISNIPIKNSDQFTDLISEQLLRLLRSNLSVPELIDLLPETTSGAFIMARFGLHLQFFQSIISELPPDVTPIYHTAKAVREKTNSEEITGAVLVVAVIENLPDYERILGQFKLTLSDLHQGIIWFNYLNNITKDAKKPIRSGGIARDFAFGFTPTLQHFAINLSTRYSGNVHRLQQAANLEIVNTMIRTFSENRQKNIALIGAYGSGRSTIVNAFAETIINAEAKIPSNLKFSQVYSLDAPSLISSARNQGELEYLMIKILNEIYSAKNIILCLDNAHLFFEEGPGSIDISNLLVPVLENGKIRILLTMDDQKYLEISARNTALANALHKIFVKPSNREETIKILMDQTPYIENQKSVIYTYQSLTAAYRLSEQYIHDVEMPGRAKMLLESSADYAEGNLVTENSVQTAIEKTYGVKVKANEESEDRARLLNLEALIHERMIDQKEAVSAVSNALRRAGAGIKNQHRPIGTFLFLGPTGVGKTELAKSLSEVYFGGENKLIRLDMNEFVSAQDVSRLIRDATSDPTSLTAEVSKQPFSVVLLDEIEKAHPSVLTTLLQVLDEGVLRDEKNREISFRDTIIIATSNAGANEIREKITSGAKIEDFKEDFIESLISSDEFKPEFLNRFDEICLFKPLSKEDLVQILDLIIASTNRTLEPQKISVEVTPEAKQILIDKGYDPKMGARPMRRIVQKTVENIVATAILSGAANPGSTLTITPDKITIQ